MTKNRDNYLTNESSGKPDNHLLNSDDIIHRRPDFSYRIFSPAQVAHLSRWEQAKAYGRMAISDPELNDYYSIKAQSKKGLGAWHLAIHDYFRLPSIHSIRLCDYTGRHGDSLEIFVFNHLKIREVRVAIISKEDKTVEEGPAAEVDTGLRWIYQVVHDFLPVPGTRISIRAVSLPGHVSDKEFIFTGKIPIEVDFRDSSAQGACGKRKMKSRL